MGPTCPPTKTRDQLVDEVWRHLARARQKNGGVGTLELDDAEQMLNRPRWREIVQRPWVVEFVREYLPSRDRFFDRLSHLPDDEIFLREGVLLILLTELIQDDLKDRLVACGLPAWKAEKIARSYQLTFHL